VGGSVANSMEISSNRPLGRGLILPGGIRPNQQVTDTHGVACRQCYSMGGCYSSRHDNPFPSEISPGLRLSDTFSGDYADSKSNDQTKARLLYIISTFWESSPHTVSCYPPCTLVLPPIKTQSTWTPGAFITTISSATSTVKPPLQEHTEYPHLERNRPK
jgi:hypothetical protein